jgi:outer membrane protein assembly factor BamB
MTHSFLRWIAVFTTSSALAASALAVSTSTWTQTSENDFKDGTFENVVATNLGDLKLSRAVQTLLENDPKISSVNTLAEGPDGTIYAGTGPHGVVLRIKGDDVKPILTLADESYVFALAFDKQNRLLIGTGGDAGRILRLDKPLAGQKPTELFKAEGVQYVWALRVTADGNVYAATGPTGQLYELRPDGTSKLLLDTAENNLLSLIADSGDYLYAGTDPNGLVYRINRKTGEAFILYDAAETEVSALALDAKGNLYAATAESHDEQGQAQAAAASEQTGRPEGSTTGVPLPSERPKPPEPPKLPDPTPGQPDPIPKEGSPKKLDGAAQTSTLDPRPVLRERGPGALIHFAAYVADAPPADGGAPAAPGQPHPNPKPSPSPAVPNAAGAENPMPGRPPVDPRAAGQPRPEGNAVYRIDKEGFVSEIFRQPVLILGMAERQGTLLLATGSEGNVYQVSPAAEETIVLAKVNPKQVSAILPATDGRVYLGLANSGGVAAMSPGFAPGGTFTSSVLDATQVSRFGKMQLRGTLPEGTGLTVATRSGNVKDATAAQSWSAWSAEVPAAEFVQVAAPSARFLQYRLTFATKAAQTSPVVEDVTVSYQMPNLPPQIRSVKLATAADPAQSQQQAGAEAAEPVRVPSARKQTITWEASDPNGDTVSYGLWFRRGSGAPWILLKEKIRETTYEWDTRSVADGRYEVKVVASDAPSNPPGKGKGGARVGDAIIVDNTPPVVGDVKWVEKGASVEVSLKAVDRSSTVAALDYSVDSNKDWQAVLPEDGIFDGPDESVAFSLPGLAPGPHQVTLRATDAKGNQAFENVIVNVRGPAAAK